MNDIITTDILQQQIFTIRNKRVMLDRDLAELYGVKTMVLNQAVKRDIERFPNDFMFRLTKNELQELITNCDRLEKLKHSPTTPLAFTEHGVTMLSSVLNSKKAIEINIQVVRAFIALHQFAVEYKDLQEQIIELRDYFIQYANDNNNDIDKINAAINLLTDRTKPAKIGFKAE